MKFPKLKNALLCRILVYVVILGTFIAPIVVVACIHAIPEVVKGFFGLTMGIALLVYVFRNLVTLWGMDVVLALTHCRNTTRIQFPLSKRHSIKSIEKRLSRYGKGYAPTPLYPQPLALRYKFNTPAKVFSRGIEKVVTVYRTPLLDNNTYGEIFRSANTNSKSLIGKKRALLISKYQRKQPLNRVTVIAILAEKVEPSFSKVMFQKVCQQDGDGNKIAIVPCIIDIQNHLCVFNCEREPFMGFGYPVKNRGIRIIRRRVFGSRLPLKNNPYTVEPIKDLDPNQSLWSFWRTTKKMFRSLDKEEKKRFESMKHRQILSEDDGVYVKWENRGIWIPVEFDKETQTAKIEPFLAWTYPKSNTIAKKTKVEIQKEIFLHFAELGYSCKFLSMDDL